MLFMTRPTMITRTSFRDSRFGTAAAGVPRQRGIATRFALVMLCLLALVMARPDVASSQANRSPVRIDEIAPNPLVQGSTRISFVVPAAGAYNLKIFTVDGSLVASVLDSETNRGGVHIAMWDGRGIDGSLVSNGIYFCRIQYGRLVQAMPVIVMR